MTNTKTLLFDTQPQKGELPETSGDTTEGTSYLTNLVGEGKKFKDTEALAKGKQESDEFIARLQAELEDTRKELNTRLSIEEFWDRMKSSPDSNSDAQKRNKDDGNREMTNNEKTSNGGVIDESAIHALVQKALATEMSAQTKRQNAIAVRAELIKTWGPDYTKKINDRADALGTNADFLASIAETNPKVFLELMKGNDQPKNTNNSLNAPRSSVNPMANNGVRGDVKNKAYFDKLRKDNPRQYWSAEVQNQMYMAVKELGDLFYR